MSVPPDPSTLPLVALGRALRRLRRDQGEPSLRDIARDTAVVDVKGRRQLSHTTVGTILKCQSLPPWPSLQRVVAVLGGDVNEFRKMWIEVKDALEAHPTDSPSRPPAESPWSTDASDGFETQMSDVPIDSEGVTYVEETDLESTQRIAQGAVGELFLVVRHAIPGYADQPLAYKKVRPTIAGNDRARMFASMEGAIALRSAMSPSDRAELDRVAVWPLAVVRNNGEYMGTIMPVLPRDFFIELTMARGRELRVHEFAFLSMRNSLTTRLGIDTSIIGNPLVRLSLVAQLAYAISLLHKHAIVYGDLSLSNIAIAMNPPRVILMDCDAVASLSDHSRRQLHTPFFLPPENLSGDHAVQDLETDVYKLGLCTLRGLVSGPGATQISNPKVAAELLGQEGVDLITRALSPNRSERPTAHQISISLMAVLVNRIASKSPPKSHESIFTEYPITVAPQFASIPIYISYQRSDPHAAFLLAEYLSDSLGDGSVFINDGGFDPGADIPAATDKAVARCRAMLVVIGLDWLTVSDTADVPCIEDPHDPLRLELDSAFARNMPIIPVLLDNARRPKAAQLPSSLTGLALRSASHVRSTTFKSDVTALADQLKRMFLSEDHDNGDMYSGDFV